MEKIYIDYICNRLSVEAWRVENAVNLISEGATVPFISRYRKERTGGLDEAEIAEIKHLAEKFDELENRKRSIIDSLTKSGKLTERLKEEIDGSLEMSRLEDIYLPYRPKRKTRASVAKEKGLEPLAEKIYNCRISDPQREAASYLSESVSTTDEALSGARDIMAEWISETLSVREDLRRSYAKYGKIYSKVARGVDKESEEAQKYLNYFDFKEPLSRAASHRILAMLRGANEGFLSVEVEMDEDRVLDRIYDIVLRRKRNPSDSVAAQIDYAVEDAYKRMLHPSIENETLKGAKERADIESVKVFGENLRQLLMAPPLGQKRVLAIDPGFRTGCKVVCLDSQGALLHNDTIYPHPPKNERTMAVKKISDMVEAYGIEVIAIGNGTAGRETEAFIRHISLPEGVKVYPVSEDGASVYSASSVAREEFPEYDVTVRGAVSIGRRIMDPLAELVKIDPKSIGVGQYQHDVNQELLRDRLTEVVEYCVNSVGVNLNTASRHLLSYVSGIGPALAANIVEYRDQNGPFGGRRELLRVKRLGEKAFEQCAGFLRIPGAENPLDNSAVHPERYSLVENIAADRHLSVKDLMEDTATLQGIDLKRYVTPETGMPTLTDIVKELSKPGRDPRESFKVLEFSNDIRTIEDLKVGMELPGIVTNITNFGAFVDFGIKQNGLIHLSRLSQGGRRVSSPSQVLKLHQHVKVRVLEIDFNRARIALEPVSERV